MSKKLISRRFIPCISLMLLAVLSCGGSTNPSPTPVQYDCHQVCSQVSQKCPFVDLPTCENIACGPVQFPSGCLAALNSASCSDLESHSGAYMDACYPRCNNFYHECSATNVYSECAPDCDGEPRLVSYSCDDLCESHGYPRRSTCSPGASITTEDELQCWCTGNVGGFVYDPFGCRTTSAGGHSSTDPNWPSPGAGGTGGIGGGSSQ